MWLEPCFVEAAMNHSIACAHVLLSAVAAFGCAVGTELSPSDTRDVSVQSEGLSAPDYCGGPSASDPGRALDLNRECQTFYGAASRAVGIRQDAYGWVCQTPGRADAGIDMNAACRRSYGASAFAALKGIHLYDWQCLLPTDVRGRVVPVLLVPYEKLNAGEISGVAAALGRVTALLGGTRAFYAAHAGRPVPATRGYVQITGVPARHWEELAIATDHLEPGFQYVKTVDRYGYFYKVQAELRQYASLTTSQTLRVGGFIYEGAAPAWTPTWLGASAAGAVFVPAPSATYASCMLGLEPDSRYQNAFYAVGHEMGHTFGLPHTDGYGVPLTADDQKSMMYFGDGVRSRLLSFEASRLSTFLANWR
jgi:hypothetical protein